MLSKMKYNGLARRSIHRPTHHHPDQHGQIHGNGRHKQSGSSKDIHSSDDDPKSKHRGDSGALGGLGGPGGAEKMSRDHDQGDKEIHNKGGDETQQVPVVQNLVEMLRSAEKLIGAGRARGGHSSRGGGAGRGGHVAGPREMPCSEPQHTVRP